MHLRCGALPDQGPAGLGPCLVAGFTVGSSTSSRSAPLVGAAASSCASACCSTASSACPDCVSRPARLTSSSSLTCTPFLDQLCTVAAARANSCLTNCRPSGATNATRCPRGRPKALSFLARVATAPSRSPYETMRWTSGKLSAGCCLWPAEMTEDSTFAVTSALASPGWHPAVSSSPSMTAGYRISRRASRLPSGAHRASMRRTAIVARNTVVAKAPSVRRYRL
jgi:hypothetical protein